MARITFPPGQPARFGNFLARREVIKCTAAVNRQARQNAPGGPYSTGRLKSSINWRLVSNVQGSHVRAVSGTELEYAIYVHGGTDAHTIRASRAPQLKFYWRKVGRFFRGPEVNHPGQAEQPFLTDALRTVAPRFGFRVIIYRT